MRGTQQWPPAGPQATTKQAAAKPASARAKCAIWARVSTVKQHTENQEDVLRAWAAEQGLEVAAEFITEDSAWHHNGNGSKGRKFDKAREDLLAGAQAGRYTVVLVWALDRLSRRGYSDLAPLLATLNGHGCELRSYQEQWLTTVGPFGEILVHIFAWMAEQESARRSQRTRAGLEAAAAKGHKGGRKPALTPEQEQSAVDDFDAGMGVSAIAAKLGIPNNRAAVYRALHKHGRMEEPAGNGGRPPISGETREAIMRLLRAGESISATARATKTSAPTVKKTWLEDRTEDEPEEPPGAGRGTGRPHAASDEAARIAAQLVDSGQPVAAVARVMGKSENTMRRAIERVRQEATS